MLEFTLLGYCLHCSSFKSVPSQWQFRRREYMPRCICQSKDFELTKFGFVKLC